jgi:hypothetical protein
VWHALPARRWWVWHALQGRWRVWPARLLDLWMCHLRMCYVWLLLRHLHDVSNMLSCALGVPRVREDPEGVHSCLESG